MSRPKLIALAFAGVLALTGMASVSAHAQTAQPQATQPQNIQFTNVDRGSRSALGRNAYVIKSEDDWSELWSQHKSGNKPMPHKPVIDFQKEMVIGVFLGMRGNLGYEVTIDSIVDTGNELTITYTEHSPPRDGIMFPSTCEPFQLVRLPLSAKPVVFQDSAQKKVAKPPTASVLRYRVVFKNEVTNEEISQALDGKAQLVSMKRVAARPSDPGFKVDLRGGTGVGGDELYNRPAAPKHTGSGFDVTLGGGTGVGNDEVLNKQVPKQVDPEWDMTAPKPVIWAFAIELKTQLPAADMTTTLQQLPQVARADLNTAQMNTSKFTIRFKPVPTKELLQAALGDNIEILSMKSLDIDGGDPGLFLLELRSEKTADEAAKTLRGLSQVDPQSVYVR